MIDNADLKISARREDRSESESPAPPSADVDAAIDPVATLRRLAERRDTPTQDEQRVERMNMRSRWRASRWKARVIARRPAPDAKSDDPPVDVQDNLRSEVRREAATALQQWWRGEKLRNSSVAETVRAFVRSGLLRHRRPGQQSFSSLANDLHEPSALAICDSILEAARLHMNRSTPESPLLPGPGRRPMQAPEFMGAILVLANPTEMLGGGRNTKSDCFDLQIAATQLMSSCAWFCRAMGDVVQSTAAVDEHGSNVGSEAADERGGSPDAQHGAAMAFVGAQNRFAQLFRAWQQRELDGSVVTMVVKYTQMEDMKDAVPNAAPQWKNDIARAQRTLAKRLAAVDGLDVLQHALDTRNVEQMQSAEARRSSSLVHPSPSPLQQPGALPFSPRRAQGTGSLSPEPQLGPQPARLVTSEHRCALESSAAPVPPPSARLPGAASSVCPTRAASTAASTPGATRSTGPDSELTSGSPQTAFPTPPSPPPVEAYPEADAGARSDDVLSAPDPTELERQRRYPASATLVLGVDSCLENGLAGILNDDILHMLVLDPSTTLLRPAFGTASATAHPPTRDESGLVRTSTPQAASFWQQIFREYDAVANGRTDPCPCIMSMLRDLVDQTLAVCPNEHREMVQDALDLELIQDMLCGGVFGWDDAVRLIESFVHVLHSTQAPDEVAVAAYRAVHFSLHQGFQGLDSEQVIERQKTVLSEGLLHVQDIINVMRVDCANKHITSVVPILQEFGVEYEKERCEQRVIRGELFFDLTRNWLRWCIREVVASGQLALPRLLASDREAISKLHRFALMVLVKSPTPLFQNTCPETLIADAGELASMQRRFLLHVALASITTALGSSFATLNPADKATAMQRICTALVDPSLVYIFPEAVLAAAMPAIMSLSCFPDATASQLVLIREGIRPGTHLNRVLKDRVAALWIAMLNGDKHPVLPPAVSLILVPDVTYWVRRLSRIAEVDLAVHGTWYSCLVHDASQEMQSGVASVSTSSRQSTPFVSPLITPVPSPPDDTGVPPCALEPAACPEPPVPLAPESAPKGDSPTPDDTLPDKASD